MITYIAGLFAANFTFIFLKAIQQLNVAGGHYLWVAPTSLGLAGCEVFLIAKIANSGMEHLLVACVTLGVAGGVGSMVAMWIHGRRSK